MLLERLFENLALRVKPIAVCEVARGWRLQIGALECASSHFVLHGNGVLRSGKNLRQALGPYSLAVVPPQLSHAIQSGEPVSGETLIEESLKKASEAQGDGTLVVACGEVQITYAGGSELFDRMREPFVLDFSDSQEMRILFEHLVEEERSGSPARRAMMVALMNQCLVMVFRRLCADPECPLPWLSADCAGHRASAHRTRSTADRGRFSRPLRWRSPWERFG